MSEHVEHAGNDSLADRHLQGMARIVDAHPARQPLRGCQRNTPYPPSIQLLQHFDDDLSFCSGTQYSVHRRQTTFELNVNHSAAHRDYCTLIVHMAFAW